MSEKTVRTEWNLACPGCKSDESLHVSVTVRAALTLDGTEPVGDHEWDDRSTLQCTACAWLGTVGEAEVERTFGEPYRPTFDEGGQNA